MKEIKEGVIGVALVLAGAFLIVHDHAAAGISCLVILVLLS